MSDLGAERGKVLAGGCAEVAWGRRARRSAMLRVGVSGRSGRVGLSVAHGRRGAIGEGAGATERVLRE